MIRKIKVLIVDDSTVIRRLLTDALSADPAIEVVGIAANGKIALAKIPQLNPDIITLDIEMPEMNGLETLVELRKQYLKLPVIMFSTLTARGAEATMDALQKGANDYVTKPSNVGSVTQAIQNVRSELIPKIKAFCPWTTPTAAVPMAIRPLNRITTLASMSPVTKSRSIDAIVIGVSTGGPNALQAMLPKLPETLPVPVLIVQHMPPIFTKHLADRLNQLSPLRVAEATDGAIAAPGTVWIAPGDFHMRLRRENNVIVIKLDKGNPENSCRPAVDVLFRSAAELFGPNVLAVVLTGMGQDGARGCGAIRERGGRAFAQDEATSVVWGMPGSVVQAGLADKVIPLDQIAQEMIQETQQGRRVRTLAKAGAL